MTSSGHVAQVETGKRMNMRLRDFLLLYLFHSVPFCSILFHFLVVVRVGGWQPLMCSVVHVFLVVKSGEARMDSCPIGVRGDVPSQESLMSVATDTTKHEKDDGLSVAARLVAGAGSWIPAPYRGTG